MVKDQTLIPAVLNIVAQQHTERPFTGPYTDCFEAGSYLCRRCGLALFRSEHKFHSGCGWPSFDDAILETVVSRPDKDGLRTEIICQRCQGHLGHVFEGEYFTAKNLRHCVNSLSLDYVDDKTIIDTGEWIVGGGCFWGLQFLFESLPGVLKTEVGYAGGHKDYPTYEDVCSGNTGHKEVIRVLFDIRVLSYESALKYFFEIHDSTQWLKQGPDYGEQYQSIIFALNDMQKNIANNLIAQLKNNGINAVTVIESAKIFWKAEEYHQNYYEKNHKTPYCHFYKKIF
jgi:peptide methionine sulfoxide reductase msrA/msrB